MPFFFSITLKNEFAETGSFFSAREKSDGKGVLYECRFWKQSGYAKRGISVCRVGRC